MDSGKGQGGFWDTIEVGSGCGCGGGGRWGLRRGKVDSGTERMDYGLVLPLRVPKTHSCIVPPEPTTRPMAPVICLPQAFVRTSLAQRGLPGDSNPALGPPVTHSHPVLSFLLVTTLPGR